MCVWVDIFEHMACVLTSQVWMVQVPYMGPTHVCLPGDVFSLNSVPPGSGDDSFDIVIFEHVMDDCCQVNATEAFKGKVNIGSGNGLVPDSTKPLPEPLLTQIHATIWCHL